MPRTKRNCPPGEVFHVLNRAVARLTIFEKPEDYSAFMRVLDETWQIVRLPIFAMVAMPNHWHFVVRPETSDQVSEFFRRLTVMRYVERNPVRANFSDLAEDWHWSSAHVRRGSPHERRWLAIPDDPPLPRNWRSWVNKVESEAELEAVRNSVKRGLPFGDHQWTKSSAVRLGLESKTRPRGRPKNET